MITVSSSTCSIDSFGRSNSSSMSPTISSSRSSSVTMPSMSPYSSMTTAMCWFARLNSPSSAARSFVSGRCARAGRCPPPSPRACRDRATHERDRARGGCPRRCRGSRGRRDTACRASPSRLRGTVPAVGRSRARRPPAAEPSRPSPPCRRSRTPCRASPAPAAGSRRARSTGRRASAARLPSGRRRQHPGPVNRARENELGRPLQDPDQRAHENEEEAHGRDHDERRPFRMAERDPFGTSSPITTCRNVRIR